MVHFFWHTLQTQIHEQLAYNNKFKILLLFLVQSTAWLRTFIQNMNISINNFGKSHISEMYAQKWMTFCISGVFPSILSLTSRTTVTSARIPGEDACYQERKLCVISHVQKGTPGLMHKGCVLQLVSLGVLSDVTVVLGMRQSLFNINNPSTPSKTTD